MVHNVALRAIAASLAFSVALSGCAGTGTSSGQLLMAPVSRVCPPERQVDFTLVIDRTNSPAVSGRGIDGAAFAIRWPEGFTLTDAGVADWPGTIVARDGQVVSTAAGGDDASGALVICMINGRTYVRS